MQQGDIYLTKFDPAFGREYKKLRPALILQNKKISESSPYVSLVGFSSNISRQGSHDIFVPMDDKNGLDQNLVLRMEYIPCFDKRRLLGKIGEVNSPTLRRVRGYLRKHFLF